MYIMVNFLKLNVTKQHFYINDKDVPIFLLFVYLLF